MCFFFGNKHNWTEPAKQSLPYYLHEIIRSSISAVISPHHHSPCVSALSPDFYFYFISFGIVSLLLCQPAQLTGRLPPVPAEGVTITAGLIQGNLTRHEPAPLPLTIFVTGSNSSHCRFTEINPREHKVAGSGCFCGTNIISRGSAPYPRCLGQ